jgi:DNA-binding CsgD family transcriptional regulator
MNEKEVAAQLGISRETVHNHIRRIYAAYNVHSRVELLLKVNPMKGIKLTLSRPDE